MAVVVQKDLPYSRCGVRSMQRTQGLTGIVLDIDEVGVAKCFFYMSLYVTRSGKIQHFVYSIKIEILLYLASMSELQVC